MELWILSKLEKTSTEKLDENLFKGVISNESDKNSKDAIIVYTEEHHLSSSNETIQELYKNLRDTILSLGDIDVDVKKTYIAFKGRRNIVDVEFYQRKLELFINMKKGTLEDAFGILIDVSTSGHHGNGDYKVMMNKIDDIDKVVPFIKQSLKINKK